jgi:hypothetical protein
MASAASIGRLHRATEPIPQFGELQPAGQERVKTAKIADSQTDFSTPLPVERKGLRKFRVGREASEAYTLDADAILSICQPGEPLNRDVDWQALAMREKTLQFARSRLRSGQRAGPGNWLPVL